MRDLEITPWFGGSPIVVQPLEGTNKVAYSWGTFPGEPEDAPKTIDHLLVWHDCDKSIWLANPTKDPDLVRRSVGWRPAGVGLHTLVTVEPLQIEASVYWPDCCGMHGWIRGGAWTDA